MSKNNFSSLPVNLACILYIHIFQKQASKVFLKKAVHKNFAIFTRKNHVVVFFYIKFRSRHSQMFFKIIVLN